MPFRERQQLRADSPPRIARLLDAAPEIAEPLGEDVVELARQALLVQCSEFATGPWTPPPQDDLLGLVVLDGFLVRKLDLRGASASELLGPGDFLRPADDDHGLVPVQSRFVALSAGQVGLLDGRFMLTLTRFPQIMQALAANLARRGQRVAMLAAIGHMKRIEDRLTVFFAHVAGEWGKVNPEGIVVPLSMPHALIADFIGAERPSVTTSLGRLRERGLIRRRSDRTWLLAHDIGEAAAESLRPNGQRGQEGREVRADSQALAAQAAQARKRSRELVEER